MYLPKSLLNIKLMEHSYNVSQETDRQENKSWFSDLDSNISKS